MSLREVASGRKKTAALQLDQLDQLDQLAKVVMTPRPNKNIDKQFNPQISSLGFAWTARCAGDRFKEQYTSSAVSTLAFRTSNHHRVFLVHRALRSVSQSQKHQIAVGIFSSHAPRSFQIQGWLFLDFSSSCDHVPQPGCLEVLL